MLTFISFEEAKRERIKKIFSLQCVAEMFFYLWNSVLSFFAGGGN